MEDTRLLSVSEILRHNNAEDCWIVVEDEVWDVTQFAPTHPGGSALLLRYAGRDATKAFMEVHSLSVIRNTLSLEFFKGNLDQSSIDSQWTQQQESSVADRPGREDAKPPLHMIINSYDFEEVAARSAPPKAFAFYSTAATDCWTRDMNQSMYKRIWFRPRVLNNVAQVDTSSSILGIPVKLPLFISPTGMAKMIHPMGEKALAQAAKSTGIIQIIPTVAGHPHDQIVQQTPDYPFFFQLYVDKQREKSEKLISMVTSLGIKAIFLTVDAAGRGKRESDERLKVEEVIVNPVTGERVQTNRRRGGLTWLTGGFIDQALTWDDLKWIRSLTDLPIILKGITSAADAKIAMDHNVNGILLSNHGGRNLDFTPPAILILLELHKQCPEIFHRMEVYIDGGIRRGGDIIKALCLGAKAVGMGRPFLYALHYGTEGVEHLVEMLQDEMESVMKLIGIRNLSQCHPGLVNTSDIDHLVPSTSGHPYAQYPPKLKL